MKNASDLLFSERSSRRFIRKEFFFRAFRARVAFCLALSALAHAPFHSSYAYKHAGGEYREVLVLLAGFVRVMGEGF